MNHNNALAGCPLQSIALTLSPFASATQR